MGGVQTGKTRTDDDYINVFLNHFTSMLVNGSEHIGGTTPSHTCWLTCFCLTDSHGMSKDSPGMHAFAAASMISFVS